MKRLIQTACLGAFLLVGSSAQAQNNYNFLVNYYGGGVASLAGGSDAIVGTNILPGDSFNWTITGVGGYWNTPSGASSFPFMAFEVSETADRVGDWTLNLSFGGSNVFSVTQTGPIQQFIHIGTNVVNLASGLSWDTMELSYTLTSSIESPDYAPDPDNLQNTNSTITKILPIFGAPEYTSPDQIVWIKRGVPVPEPSALLLLTTGFAAILVTRRFRKV